MILKNITIFILTVLLYQPVNMSVSLAVSGEDSDLAMLEQLPPHLRPLFFYGEMGEGITDEAYPEEYSLFDKDGAGMELVLLPMEIMDEKLFQEYPEEWEMMKITGGFPLLFSESYAINGIGSSCGTYNCAETIAMAPYINKSTCQAINAREGITSASDEPPETNVDMQPYPMVRVLDPNDSHNWKTTLFQGVITSTGGDISGKQTACVASTADGGDPIYVYYTVLHAR